MKYICLLSSVLFLNCTLLCAQSIARWKVIDIATNENMPYVSISVLTNIYKSTISNTNGEFSIDNLIDTDTVLFSYVGYESRSITGSELFNKTEIQLTPKVFELP
ncbi:MAG: carboxypeptidase-like regulatory domain-containing protein, partial [Tannerellaceae bacterium]|nr:carboxypeptidase-like regulatory domain-containing protein [Tannerellaceae bacterium]